MQVLEHARSTCICCSMLSISALLVGVRVAMGGGPIGGACIVLGGVCIAGYIVQRMLGTLTMTGEEREDEFSAVADSSQ
jgi:hypothetical protein